MLSVRVLVIILSSVVVVVVGVVVRILVMMVIFKRPLTHVTRLTGFSRRVHIRIRIHDVPASLAAVRVRILNRGFILLLFSLSLSLPLFPHQPQLPLFTRHPAARRLLFSSSRLLFRNVAQNLRRVRPGFVIVRLFVVIQADVPVGHARVRSQRVRRRRSFVVEHVVHVLVTHKLASEGEKTSPDDL
jgi:hypothetical protein